VFTQGMSPYFLNSAETAAIIHTELFPHLKNHKFDAVYFYGTGNKAPENAKKTLSMLKSVFPGAEISVGHDLLGAARALCGHNKGIACIMGTGSNSCYYDGRKIRKNSPGIGYVLGDEGSGAYLGKKIIQYYLYDIFEKELKDKFDKKFRTDAAGILENVYRKPLPNRYLASFTPFLSENRGHYMIENIIEDGINDLFANHLIRYKESHQYPVHFTGAVAYHFKDVVLNLCEVYGFEPGTILKTPMEGLIKYHR
ncbi:MAG: N-acetylglucosamine kinase, partial [Chitinophagaceae bacterium]|nr:N-acetylglucosamine kinase [Chitinophagaceae bacterium]